MKKIMILTEHYPDQDNIYNYMFIHSRVLEYKKNGYDVIVLYLSNENKRYTYEDIDVYKGQYETYKDSLINFNPDVIFTHSPKKIIINKINKIKNDLNVKNYTWIHGVEALSAFRRTFNITSFQEALHLYTVGLIQEIRRILRFRRYAQFCKKENDTFVFVSNWMKNITERDNFLKLNQYKIIPNFIDYAGFKIDDIFSRKTNNILIVRSFESKKYANDISVKILNTLNTLRNDFTVTIIGKGKLFDSCIENLQIPTERLRSYKKTLSRNELKYYFKNSEYSFFLCPTRQDAQGVTMCEAMASGLLIVTNNSTAIPEFIGKSYAIIEDDIKSTALLMSKAMDNRDDFYLKTSNAMEYVKNNLSSEILIKKELDLIN